MVYRDQEFDETIKRFDLDIPNFEEVITLGVLESIYPELDSQPWVKRALDECCICYASILIVLGR